MFEAGVQSGALLEALPRLRGGGGDGGSTGAESRSSYLEMYAGKKHDAVNPEEERLARWTACHLSGMPLEPPCVCDELGNLYNKDAVVSALVAKTVPKSLPHISGLKHLIDIKLDRAKGGAAHAAVQFACPVTGAAMSGKARFVVVRPGQAGPGWVVSDRALKELPQIVQEIVGGEWTKEDVLPLNPVGEELEALKDAVAARREAERAGKKAKKAAKANGNGAAKRAAPDGDAAAENAKKVKAAAAAAVPAPAGADPAVWKSLCTDKSKDDGPKKTGNNDYMVRGGIKYI